MQLPVTGGQFTCAAPATPAPGEAEKVEVPLAEDLDRIFVDDGPPDMVDSDSDVHVCPELGAGFDFKTKTKTDGSVRHAEGGQAGYSSITCMQKKGEQGIHGL